MKDVILRFEGSNRRFRHYLRVVDRASGGMTAGEYVRMWRAQFQFEKFRRDVLGGDDGA